MLKAPSPIASLTVARVAGAQVQSVPPALAVRVKKGYVVSVWKWIVGSIGLGH